jgi:hypothetical protein
MKVLTRILEGPGVIKIMASWDAEVLGVQVHDNKPVLYYRNDPNKDQEFSLEIAAVMTGQEYDHIRYDSYLGTVIWDDGSFVLHVFTRKA